MFWLLVAASARRSDNKSYGRRVGTTRGATVTTCEDLEYIAIRFEMWAAEDHAECQRPDLPADIRHHREGRADGLKWAARELREYVICPEYVAPRHLREG
jgi:hypothetical protein